jgi:FkbM family methyltransferase
MPTGFTVMYPRGMQDSNFTSPPPIVTTIYIANERTPVSLSDPSPSHVNYAAYFVGTGFGHVDPTPSARIVTSLPHPPPLKSSWISDTALHIRFGPIPRLNSDVLISLRVDDPPLRVGGVSLVGAEAGEELLEWRALIAARDEAVGRGAAEFTFVELGAGFGRWSAAAAHLAAEAGLRARLVLVEAEPLHFEWIDTFMKGEGVSEELYTRVNALLQDDAEAGFVFVGGGGGCGRVEPSHGPLVPSDGLWAGGGVDGRPSFSAAKVEAVRLWEVLPAVAAVDLLRLDAAVVDAHVVGGGLRLLNAHVLRLYVRSPSRVAEELIATFLRGGEWFRYLRRKGAALGPPSPSNRRCGGDVGVQIWTNAGLHFDLTAHTTAPLLSPPPAPVRSHFASAFQTALKTFKDLRVIRIPTPLPFSIFVAPEEEGLSRELVANRFLAAKEAVLFHNILQDCRADPAAPPPLVVDAGANLGYFCLFAAAYGCRVVCVEPQPHVRSLLELSVAINGFDDLVTVHSNFLAASEGEAAFMSEVFTSGESAVTKTRTGMPVVSTTLDALVDEDVLLLKIDLEGYELQALAGAERLFAQRAVENLIVEIKPPFGVAMGWVWGHMRGAQACSYCEAYFVPEINSYALATIGAYVLAEGQTNVAFEDVWVTRNRRLFAQLRA